LGYIRYSVGISDAAVVARMDGVSGKWTDDESWSNLKRPGERELLDGMRLSAARAQIKRAAAATPRP